MLFINIYVKYNQRILAEIITTSSKGLSPSPTWTLAISLTTSIPSITFPNAGCFESRKLLSTKFMKNWLEETKVLERELFGDEVPN